MVGSSLVEGERSRGPSHYDDRLSRFPVDLPGKTSRHATDDVPLLRQTRRVAVSDLVTLGLARRRHRLSSRKVNDLTISISLLPLEVLYDCRQVVAELASVFIPGGTNFSDHFLFNQSL